MNLGKFVAAVKKQVCELVTPKTHEREVGKVEHCDTDPNEDNARNGSLQIEESVVYFILADEHEPVKKISSKRCLFLKGSKDTRV